MAVRPIDANAMLDELRPVSFEAEHSAVLLSDVSKMMREWVERQPTLTPPNEWVSVEDRLPDTDGAYLVYAPTYTGGSSSSLDCIGGIMFSRFLHEKWSIESGYYKRPNCVTHWMPIPTPYDIDHIHISEPPDGKKGWDKDGKSRRGTKL